MQDVNWLSDDEQQLWRVVIAAFRGVERAIDHRLQEVAGISSADFAVLVVLSEAPEGRIRMRELCRHLAWDRSRVSHQITRMGKRSLVEKCKCEGDNRGINVALTDKGLDVVRKAAPDHVESVRHMVFDQMGPIDLERSVAMFERIATASARLRGEEVAINSAPVGRNRRDDADAQ
ncbi:MarR family winged helix-turn-helix transcriptional regulator [Corynebacterium sp. 335C]